ncbi:hypothetical protein ARTHRO8AJ_10087 [Arthrobacter sp. 8AJ]|nr:hypothetical protein ARTHRO8AJ_10087 [Arthrobacter sp. 8AJ]
MHLRRLICVEIQAAVAFLVRTFTAKEVRAADGRGKRVPALSPAACCPVPARCAAAGETGQSNAARRVLATGISAMVTLSGVAACPLAVKQS